jgi:uncharacterized phage protein (TIGR02220 family)
VSDLEFGVKLPFLQIQNELIDDVDHFEKYEKWVWIVLARHAFGGLAYPSQKTIAEKVGISDRKIRDCLKGLESKGWIVKNGINEATQTVKWKVVIPEEIEIEWLEKEIERKREKGNKTKKDGGTKQTEDKPPKDEIPYKQIIDHLNERTGKNFRHTTAATKKAISGRWGDEFRLKDFIHVIDVKTEEWKGTDMEQHLNPDTLFRPSNFEKYLNQKPKRSKQPQFKKPQPKRSPGAAMTEEERRALLAEAGIPLD